MIKKICIIIVIEHILLCYFLLFHGLAQHYIGLDHFSYQFLWQNKDMKKRFWFAYYWIMISYLILLLTIYLIASFSDSMPNILKWANETLFFDSMYIFTYMDGTHYIGGFNHYYSFLVVLLMTVIRFIAIEKHIWQRP